MEGGKDITINKWIKAIKLVHYKNSMDYVTKSLSVSCDMAEKKHRQRGERKSERETHGQGNTPKTNDIVAGLAYTVNTFRARRRLVLRAPGLKRTADTYTSPQTHLNEAIR